MESVEDTRYYFCLLFLIVTRCLLFLTAISPIPKSTPILAFVDAGHANSFAPGIAAHGNLDEFLASIAWVSVSHEDAWVSRVTQN